MHGTHESQEQTYHLVAQIMIMHEHVWLHHCKLKYLTMWCKPTCHWCSSNFVDTNKVSNEEFLKNKHRVIRTATKRTETSHWPPTQCTYVPSSLCCDCTVWVRDVSALGWRSATCTCLCPFCGNPIYPVYIKKIFITCLHSFLHTQNFNMAWNASFV